MTPGALAALHGRAMPPDRPWSAAEIAEVLAGRGAFLVEDEGGFAIARVVADEAELLTLAVDPGLRRRGIGASLLARVEALAADRGAARAFLEVAADNAPALALYRGAGWTETGRRRGYYGRSEGGAADALVLAKRLPEA